MVFRSKTKEECIAAALLLGEDWTYGIMSHTFMRGASLENGKTRITEMRCAETFELITNKEASARRAEERQRQNEEIQYNIWQREEARTHAASEDES